MDYCPEKYVARIVTPTGIAAVSGAVACVISDRVDPFKVIGHTAAYVFGRESVRLMRAGDQDDLLNSVVGGLGGGACYGFLHYRRIGLAGVGRYAAMYSVVGTAVDYATSGLRSALDRQMDADLAARRNYWKEVNKRLNEERSRKQLLTGIASANTQPTLEENVLRSCLRVYFPSLLAGAREFVRFNRVGDPDDLLNSIIGGLGGGACHGFLHYRRIGLAGVGRYAAMYCVVGTAVDYAASGIRSALDGQVDGLIALRRYVSEQNEFLREEQIRRKDL